MELDDLKKDFDLLVAELRACGAQGDDIHHLNCPFHDDKSGSLSAYTSKEGFAQFKCHGCDASGSVVDARIRRNKCSLKEAIESLTGENGHHPPAVATPVKKKEYPKYPDYDTMIASMSSWAERQGNKLAGIWKYISPYDDKIDYVTMRIDIGGEPGSKGKTKKRFSQAHAIEDGFQVGGYDLGKLPLYNRKGVSNAKRVVVVEGEKCVDALSNMDIPATTSPMGAGKAAYADWSLLAGKEVVLWPDNDDVGRAHVDEIAGILSKLNPPCITKIVKIPLSLEAGQDVFDYVVAGKQDGINDDSIKANISTILANAKRAGILSTGLTIPELAKYDVENDSNKLLGTGRWLCKGGACLVVGQTGIGKSTLAMQAALTWATGKPFFGIQPIQPLTSLFMQAENDVGDLAEQAQGVLKSGLLEDDLEMYRDRVLIFDEDRLAGDEFCERLQNLVAAYRPNLVWIDPLHAYLGGDMNDAEVCSKFLRRGLNPIAHTYGCAIFILHHTKKPSMDIVKKMSMGDYSYLGAGSAELANWPRANLVIRRLEEEDKMGEGYQLIAGKRGQRSGLSTSENPFDESQKGNQSIFLKHAPVGLCWLPREEQKPPEDELVTAQKLDAHIAAEDAYKAMVLNQNYNEKELRSLFMQVHGLKKTRRTELYTTKTKWGAAWKLLTDNTPVNPQMSWCYQRTEDAFPEPKKPLHDASPGDHQDSPNPDSNVTLPFDEDGA